MCDLVLYFKECMILIGLGLVMKLKFILLSKMEVDRVYNFFFYN